MLSGTGGTENYTIGQIRELNRRGIKAQIITIGLGKNDGRKNFRDIKFHATTMDKVAKLTGPIVFVNSESAHTYNPTKNKGFVALHIPPDLSIPKEKYVNALKDKGLIVPSEYSRRLWGDFLGRYDLNIVYPFATPDFVIAPAPPYNTGKILFAGRLTAGKGIYTLLAALTPFDKINKVDVVATGTHTSEGRILRRFIRWHPKINIIPAQHTFEDMANLLVGYDVVIMPSSDSLWHESFGILSIEAQHAGCRVVASRGGGLPETDCGGLILIDPDNPMALQKGILEGLKLGRLTDKERVKAGAKFTLSGSVDSLLWALSK